MEFILNQLLVNRNNSWYRFNWNSVVYTAYNDIEAKCFVAMYEMSMLHMFSSINMRSLMMWNFDQID